MNLEVEIKVGIPDYASARKAIAKLGKFIKKEKQTDIYYTPPGRDYYSEKPVKYYLRTRETRGKYTFEFHRPNFLKGKKAGSEEYEVEISDKKTFLKIIRFIGLKKAAVVSKEREYFMCGNFEVALDKVMGLGNFMEVEAKRKGISKKDCMDFAKKSGVRFRILKNNNYALMALGK